MVVAKKFKVAAVLIALGYGSVLVYQGGLTFNPQENQPVKVVVTENVELETAPSLTKNITLDDVFISVKTTSIYQNTRLPIILKTWFQLAKDQTWFFTDADNQQLQEETNGHLINTKCPSSHSLLHLCCKMSAEYDYFLESGKKWLCHFDDDNYVNVPRLVSVLQTFNPQENWYLGKTSTREPVKITNDHTVLSTFWFGTGGAGFCISRSLALKMSPFAGLGKFNLICKSEQFPDDVSMGYLIEYILETNLTNVPEFHSHLERMKLLEPETFKDQISFGYSKNKNGRWNVVDVPGFEVVKDPTRFLSLHCFLFPHFKFCPR